MLFLGKGFIDNLYIIEILSFVRFNLLKSILIYRRGDYDEIVRKYKEIFLPPDDEDYIEEHQKRITCKRKRTVII